MNLNETNFVQSSHPTIKTLLRNALEVPSDERWIKITWDKRRGPSITRSTCRSPRVFHGSMIRQRRYRYSALSTGFQSSDRPWIFFKRRGRRRRRRKRSGECQWEWKFEVHLIIHRHTTVAFVIRAAKIREHGYLVWSFTKSTCLYSYWWKFREL